MLEPGEIVVMKGTFLYDGTVECDIRIVFSPICYGSGDYEDPEELREDQQVDNYYIQYGSTTNRDTFGGRVGCYPSLEEATAEAVEGSAIGPTIKWLD